MTAKWMGVAAAAAMVLAAALPARAEDGVYSFGVLNQRSPTLTAEYWNPILDHVGRKAGVRLEMRMGKTAPETSAMIGEGAFDFVYSNTIFTPSNARVGYGVIARPIEDAIQGQIVALEPSPIHSLAQLHGKEVGFPSRVAFVGYAVPMNALLKAEISANAVFAGNQEGIMGQLRAGKVMAAGVNSKVMRDYAKREGIKYRILWSSVDYLNLPISVHPRVAAEVARKVRAAFLGMAADPEGATILERSAAVIKQPPPFGFIAADDAGYQSYHDYYKNSLVPDIAR